MKLLQQKLVDRGYDVGGIDGILGTNTREAVRQEQIAARPAGRRLADAGAARQSLTDVGGIL